MSTNESPNVLMIMADQLSACALGAYNNSVVSTPNIDRLANEGVVFENCYCNNPICVPSRASMVSGRLSSSIGIYDNGCELPASTSTFLHYLRNVGYKTILSGKMHFIGPDQLHGFEERLTSDIYPASFEWTPDWRQGIVLNKGSNVQMVQNSGKCLWGLQLDYDEEVRFKTIECLRREARRLQDEKERPFFLCASFTHPHDPFYITAQWWNVYNNSDINPPCVPFDDCPYPYNTWIQRHHGQDVYPLTLEQVMNSRHAYYAMCSYFDHLTGSLLEELDRLNIADNTIVFITSDHGEMLGEHGMWFKRTYYDEATRVPMIIRWKGVIPTGRRVEKVISLVDLFPTMCEICNADAYLSNQLDLDGDSFAHLIASDDSTWKDEAVLEYLGEGTLQPMRMLRKGDYKYISVNTLKPLLFDMRKNPHETKNLAEMQLYKSVIDSMEKQVSQGWNVEMIRQNIMKSQQQRITLNSALAKGRQTKWDYRPGFDLATQYVSWNGQEENRLARYPRI